MKKEENPNTLIVGSQQEYEKTLQLMKEAGLQERVLGRVAVSENDVIGHWLLEKSTNAFRGCSFPGSYIL